MRIGVMQPYLFPYLGYFEIIAQSDTFIFYDDVDFIRRGWINRNNLIINKEKKLFTIPVQKTNVGVKISEVELVGYADWKDKFLITLLQNYKKSTNFDRVYNLIQDVLNKSDYKYISELAINSLTMTSSYLGLKTTFVKSSELKVNDNLTKEFRLFEIAKVFKAKEIVMPVGSLTLYEGWPFEELRLKTLKKNNFTYCQKRKLFEPNLSIIDVLMHVEKEVIVNILKSSKFV